MSIGYDVLGDGEIDIVLCEKYSGDSAKGFVPAYRFNIVLHKTGKSVGHINLRLEDTEKVVNYIGHIGYGVEEPYRGKRIASRACNLIKKVADDLGMERLIITCNPDNYASIRTCEIIGAKLIEIIDIPETSDAYGIGETQKCRYEWMIKSDF